MTRGVRARAVGRARAAAAALSLAGAALAGAAADAGAQAPGAAAEVSAASPLAARVAPEPGENLTVYLMTIGPGDAVWERFGHNAIWIRDARTGAEVAYNWGMFDFNQPNFLGRFLTGETRYWMEGFDAGMLAQHYARVENRSVWRQELALTPSQRLALLEFVTWNARDENKYYRYDYYRDNCSTRVRDAIDRVLGGAIRRATFGVPSRTSYRWHTRRLTAGDPATYTGIELALGRPADREISAWEEGFLPVQLMDHLREVRVPAPLGQSVPLVVREDTLFTARRDPEPAAPPATVGYYAAAGAALAVALALLGRAAGAARRRARRSPAAAGLAAVAGLWTLVTGLAGAALLLAGTVTRHVFMGRNLNLAVVNPLALVILALVLVAAAARRPERRAAWSGRAARAAALLAALSVAGALLMLVPAAAQRSWDVYALALPANLALWWALRQAAGGEGVAHAR